MVTLARRIEALENAFTVALHSISTALPSVKSDVIENLNRHAQSYEGQKILTLFLQAVRLLSESRALTPPLKADFCYLAATDVGGFNHRALFKCRNRSQICKHRNALNNAVRANGRLVFSTFSNNPFCLLFCNSAERALVDTVNTHLCSPPQCSLLMIWIYKTYSLRSIRFVYKNHG